MVSHIQLEVKCLKHTSINKVTKGFKAMIVINFEGFYYLNKKS